MSDLFVGLGALTMLLGTGLLGWGLYVMERTYVWGGMLLACVALWIILGTVAVSGLQRVL